MGPMTATGMILRAGLRGRWRAWLALALLLGVFAGAVTAVAAGSRRTDAAYPSLVRWSRTPGRAAVLVLRQGLAHVR
jgi:hypothetical protein